MVGHRRTVLIFGELAIRRQTMSNRVRLRAFSRRHALWAGFGFLTMAVTTFAAIREAAAKMAQKAADYQDTPKGDQQCSNCSLFQPPKACQLIDGDIGATGWCKYWVKKPS
jgi:hypothetical protein